MMKLVHTIVSADVGKKFIHRSACTECGHRPQPLMLGDVMGWIQVLDVGKRVYDTGDGVLQVESRGQLVQRRRLRLVSP